MSMSTVTNAIYDAVFSWYEVLVGQKPKKKSYLKYILALLCVALIGTGSFFLYRWYIMYRERAAYQTLTTYLDEYKVTLAQKDSDWAPVEDLFKLGYEQNSSSYLAPFFLVFQADALLKQGKKAEGLEVLDQMINFSDVSDPLLPLFKIKRAMVMLDMNDTHVNETGVQQLTELSNDSTNQFRDNAQYYLGQYYFVHDKVNQAKSIWQELVEQQKYEKNMMSPWAQLAQQKLNQIG